MTRTARTAALLTALAFGGAGVAEAQGQAAHSHAAPHGGEVVEVAEHHVEFKADASGAIAVWLLDAKEKTAPPPAGGKVTLMPDQGDLVTLPLATDSAGQRLVAHFDPSKLQAFQAVVSLPIEGKRHNFRFHYPPPHSH